MQIKLITNRQAEIVVPEYLYVSQDNYEIMPVGGLVKYYHYLYCDSATSCIVVIVSGKAQDGRPSIAISHLSRPQRFAKFFSEVENNFTGEICVFAHGANPPQPGTNSDGTPDYTALRNLGIVNDWISNHSAVTHSGDKLTIIQATLLFGEGNPSVYESDLDCYGVDISNPKNLIVSNKRFALSAVDRDPSGGLQTLFCIYGLRIEPQMVLLRTAEAFDRSNPNSLYANEQKLLTIAGEDNFERYANMSDAGILAALSSTPDAEVPWFCDTIRQAAQYVKINL